MNLSGFHHYWLNNCSTVLRLTHLRWRVDVRTHAMVIFLIYEMNAIVVNLLQLSKNTKTIHFTLIGI